MLRRLSRWWRLRRAVRDRSLVRRLADGKLFIASHPGHRLFTGWYFRAVDDEEVWPTSAPDSFEIDPGPLTLAEFVSARALQRGRGEYGPLSREDAYEARLARLGNGGYRPPFWPRPEPPREASAVRPHTPPLTEGMVRKGGLNLGPSQVTVRPPPPPMRVVTKGWTFREEPMSVEQVRALNK